MLKASWLAKQRTVLSVACHNIVTLPIKQMEERMNGVVSGLKSFLVEELELGLGVQTSVRSVLLPHT